jgi:hypothetical protein
MTSGTTTGRPITSSRRQIDARFASCSRHIGR